MSKIRAYNLAYKARRASKAWLQEAGEKKQPPDELHAALGATLERFHQPGQFLSFFLKRGFDAFCPPQNQIISNRIKGIERFRISRKWLQLDSEQIQDLLLWFRRLGDLFKLGARHADLLLANATQMLDHIFHRPFPILAFAILFK